MPEIKTLPWRLQLDFLKRYWLSAFPLRSTRQPGMITEARARGTLARRALWLAAFVARLPCVAEAFIVFGQMFRFSVGQFFNIDHLVVRVNSWFPPLPCECPE